MTTQPTDCYAILGLPRDATQAQINGAYRALLRRYHPDTRTPTDSSGDEISDAALQHVLAAYLHDPARRFDYDQHTTPRISPARTSDSDRSSRRSPPGSRSGIGLDPEKHRLRLVAATMIDRCGEVAPLADRLLSRAIIC